jgi:RNA polymerase sigma-70 factor (ECF subfamily)
MSTGEMALGTTNALEGQGREAEAGLVDRCRRGDGYAFARLVALHERMVYNLAARLLGDAEEARDLSQDVFLQVYRTLGRFRGQSSLKTWIYRIVVNQCSNRQRWWRRRRRDKACGLDELGNDGAAQLAAPEPEGGSAYEAVRRRERTREVQQALLRLSFDHRAVLLLKEVEEMSCEEIAATLGLAEGTVKSRLARARAALRARLVAAQGETS